jgi:hypothetical protein
LSLFELQTDDYHPSQALNPQSLSAFKASFDIQQSQRQNVCPSQKWKAR